MRISTQSQQIQQTPNLSAYRKIAIQRIIQGTLSCNLQDKNFPNSLPSIGTDIRTDLNIQWKPAQPEYKQSNYSEDINNLQQPQYINRSITQCLLVLNWFVPYKFAQIFSERIISKIRVYQYLVFIDGILYRIYINSYVPYKDGSILFADVVQCSIFGCLFEKVVAKVYGSYQAIPDNLIEMLEMWTGYAVQNISVDQHGVEEYVEFMEESFKNGNLVFFRTRNSVRLQTNGLVANKVYIIVRVMSILGRYFVEYLQLDGEEWKGKYSKGSRFWDNYAKQVEENRINVRTNTHTNGYNTGTNTSNPSNKLSRQNYLQLTQLLGISRQLTIMHNTRKHNINWLSSQQNTKHIYKLTLRPTPNTTTLPSTSTSTSYAIITLHFMHKPCRNSLYIINQQTCQLISCNYKQNRDNNFIAAQLKPGNTYLLYVYCEDIEGKGMDVNVTVYCQQLWCDMKECNRTISIEERSFIQFMENLPCATTYFDQGSRKNNIKIKNMYRELGLGMIVITIEPECNKRVTVHVSKEGLKHCQMEIINNKTDKIVYKGPCHAILMFKIKGKYQEGDIFPPPSAIKIVSQIVSEQNQIIKSLFN